MPILSTSPEMDELINSHPEEFAVFIEKLNYTGFSDGYFVYQGDDEFIYIPIAPTAEGHWELSRQHFTMTFIIFSPRPWEDQGTIANGSFSIRGNKKNYASCVQDDDPLIMLRHVQEILIREKK